MLKQRVMHHFILFTTIHLYQYSLIMLLKPFSDIEYQFNYKDPIVIYLRLFPYQTWERNYILKVRNAPHKHPIFLTCKILLRILGTLNLIKKSIYTFYEKRNILV